MTNNQYQSQKANMYKDFQNIVIRFPSIKNNDAEEFIFHYIEHDEPQLAYSNLVAMIINSTDKLSRSSCQEVVEFGEYFQMQNGIVWTREEAQEWWIKLRIKSLS